MVLTTLTKGEPTVTQAGEETLFHVTVLSNFVLAYDKYGRRYDKSKLPKTTYPDRFFLLKRSELQVGVEKTSSLLENLGLSGNRRIVLETRQEESALHTNTRTGLGRYICSGTISVSAVFWIDDGILSPVSVEVVMAQGYRVLGGANLSELSAFAALSPRSVSVLPIARGCQAACSFCFSRASISSEQKQKPIRLQQVQAICSLAKEKGATRFVITGGGEPGLVKHDTLCQLIEAGREFGRRILITNGHHLSVVSPKRRQRMLSDYATAGLNVLSISRHHHDCEKNSLVMNLRTNVREIVSTWNEGISIWPGLKMRLICVLQKGAVDSLQAIESYVDWTTLIGVGEICFKELYVSTSVESVFHNQEANQWSRQHQVPLSFVLAFAAKHRFDEVSRLPWGAPVFRGTWRGRTVQIAAYTEPSLLWERTEGMARSWNLMADGRCFASLEDRMSEVGQSAR